MARIEKKGGRVNPYRTGLGLDPHVNFTLPAGASAADAVKEIARQCHLKVGSLPPELSQAKSLRGLTVFGHARGELDKVAANYDGWEFESDGKELRTVKHGSRVSSFDELAGRLMVNAHRAENGRMTRGEHERIAAEIDKAGFKPLDYLEGESRRALALWNQHHPPEAIHTFRRALNHKKFHRAVRLRLGRAQTKYRKAHPHEAIL
jgi:hypothetical protein